MVSDRNIGLVKLFFAGCYVGWFASFLYLGLRVLRTNWARISYGFLLVFAAPVLMVHSFLWTEPAFLTGLGILSILILKVTRRSTGHADWVGIGLSLLFLLWARKAGFLLIGGTAVGLLVVMPGIRWYYRLLSLVGLGLATIFLYGVFGGPNLLGELPSISNMSKQLLLNLDGMSLWLLPKFVNRWIRMALLIGLLFAAFGQYFLRRDHMDLKFWRCLMVMFLFYFTARLGFVRPWPSEVERYLAPLFAWFFLILFSGLEAITINARWVRFLLCLWLLYPAVRTIKNARLWNSRQSADIENVTTGESRNLNP